MTLTIGNILPDASLIQMGDDGPQSLSLRDILAGRRVVLFGLPGAFTPTCSTAHLPSFMRTADQFRARGIHDIICISVNDAHVMRQWGEITGGIKAGIRFMADADSAFTTAIGMQFDAPAAGMFARSKRYSMLVEDRVLKILNLEKAPGVCELTGGETLLDQL